jgi:hypothetical protein
MPGIGGVDSCSSASRLKDGSAGDRILVGSLALKRCRGSEVPGLAFKVIEKNGGIDDSKT